MMGWGFVPSWAASKEEAWHRAIINARAETVAEKPIFLRAMERHRVIVPASGFYEWARLPGGRQPHVIRRADQDLTGFAAV